MSFVVMATWIAGLGAPSGAQAGDPSDQEPVRVSIEGKSVDLVKVPKKHLTISADCAKAPGRFACDAFAAWPRSRHEGPPARGGANPGAVVCAQVLKGKVVVGRFENGSELTLCRFADGSLLGSGSIAYAASNPDVVRGWSAGK